MKTRIDKLSVHQNSKVFAILMAAVSTVFVVPLMLIAALTAPASEGSMPVFALIFLPLVYLVLGYVMVAFGCWVYNLMAKYTGGIEYQSRDVEA